MAYRSRILTLVFVCAALAASSTRGADDPVVRDSNLAPATPAATPSLKDHIDPVRSGSAGERGLADRVASSPRFAACDVACTLDSTVEDEADCGAPVDTTNGGCDSVPPVFGTVACGETICGKVALDGGVRDTDWYQITVAQPTRLIWSILPEFPPVIGVAGTKPVGSGDCGQTTEFINPSAIGEECVVTDVQMCLPPGTHWMYVAPAGDEIIPCGSNYEVTLSCEPCVAIGACCTPEGDCVETDQATCDAYFGTFQEDGSSCDPNCCPTTAAGHDECSQAVAYAIPVDGSMRTVSGDNAGATATGDWPGYPPTWWEAFSIDQCATVWIDLCCTEPVMAPNYTLLGDDCASEGGRPATTTSWVEPRIDGCAWDNVRMVWDNLPAGTYYYPVYSDADGSVHGSYQMHISADACGTGACCREGGCVSDWGPTMSESLCINIGGEWFEGQDCDALTCPPANDRCQDAIPVAVPSETTGSTRNSRFDGVGTCSTTNTSPGVWYKVIGTGRKLRASTCNAGSSFNTKLSIFCADCDALTCISGNNDNCTGFGPALSTVQWCTEYGAEYLILVHGILSATGDFRLDVWESTSTYCPGAITCGGSPLVACCSATDPCDELPTALCCALGNNPFLDEDYCRGDNNGNGVNDACEVFGDGDGDSDVDTDDWALLLPCILGPDSAVDPGCTWADLDGDDRVDMKDVTLFTGARTERLDPCITPEP